MESNKIIVAGSKRDSETSWRMAVGLWTNMELRWTMRDDDGNIYNVVSWGYYHTDKSLVYFSAWRTKGKKPMEKQLVKHVDKTTHKTLRRPYWIDI